MRSPGPYFGPAVIGDEAYQGEVAREKSGKDVFGPAVLDSDFSGGKGRSPSSVPAAPEEPAKVPEDLQNYMVPIRLLQTTLGANPMLVDPYMQAEMARPDGIRKTAVTLLTEAERKRPGGERDEVLATLEEWRKEAK